MSCRTNKKLSKHSAKTSNSSALKRPRLSLLVLVVIIIISSFCGWYRLGPVEASSSSNQASLTEWTIPTTGSGPWALTLDPSGKCCWLLEYYGNNLAHLDPATGTFQEWQIPTPNALPYSLTATMTAGSLTLWGTEFGANQIFAFYPGTGLFHEY